MILSRLLKPRFISILIATFTALHMTAAVASKNNHDNKKETDSTISYAAIIKGTDSSSITEDDDPDADNLLEVKGKLRVSDRNSGEAAFLAESINGSYGNFVIATKGHWYYAAENSQSVIQELDNGDTLTDRLIVSSLDGTTHAVVITINGLDEVTTDTNYAAIISGIDSGSVTEDNDPDGDNLLEISAKLNITDSDTGEAAFIATTHNGNYGSLNIDATGNWNYAAGNSQSIIQNLASGDTLKDNLTVSSVDGTTHAVVITIIGADEANQAAVISGVDSGSVTEDNDPDGNNLLEAGGKLNITDSDPGEAAFIAETVNGNYGNLSIDAAGNWYYAAGNNQAVIQNLDTGATLSDTLIISSFDDTTHPIVITITGVDEPNSPALITGVDSSNLTEDVDPDGDGLLEVGARLNITDSDPGEAGFIAETVNGNYGSLTIDTAGNWSYAADNSQSAIQNLDTGATLSDTLIISSLDATTHTITITIAGNDETDTIANISLSWVAPVEREDNTPIALSAIAGYKIYYGSTQGQHPNSVSVNDGSATGYTFENFTAGTYYFVITTIDSEGRESKYSTEAVTTI